MNSTLQPFKSLLLILSLVWAGTFFTACDDDEKPKTVPTVATGVITNVTGTSATVAGKIIDDGNTAGIVSSGFVYSSTNATPTLDDSKTEEAATEGEYTSELVELEPSTIYYVRAYAINSMGTGFGEVVDFTTGNAAPVVTNLTIDGTLEVNNEITASYTYSDAENDAESGTTFQWYKADNAVKTSEAAIVGATSITYTVQEADENKFIWITVTPKAATGTPTGATTMSAITGPVGQATSITFTYNGEEVTYGILTSPITNRRWLDRNLGAPNAPMAHNDFANYGDAFQWGRGADGHQLTSRAATTAATKGVNSTTTTLSSTDSPGHGLFITASGDPADWRTQTNNNLWQGVDGINNPCPAGFRIPTKEEWETENLSTLPEAYTQMKITAGGYRIEDGNFFSTGGTGYYWTSSVANSVTTPTDVTWATYQGIGSNAGQSVGVRATGRMCRCIED